MRSDRNPTMPGFGVASVVLLLLLFGRASAWAGGDGGGGESVAASNGVASVARELTLGWQCHTNADYAGALTHYRAAAQTSPKSLDALMGSLLELLALGRFEEAEKVARGVLKEHPANYYANLRLAYSLRMQGKYGPAREIADRMMELYPADVLFLLETGLLQRACRQDIPARDTFLKVQLLDPGNPIAGQELESLQKGSPSPNIPSLAPSGPVSKFGATAIGYCGFLDYHGTASKDHANSAGVYAALGQGLTHLLEVEGDLIHKFYRGYDSLRQWDATAAYANYSIPGIKLRMGGHLVSSDDPYTDGGYVLFGGVDYQDPGSWSAGMEGCFTKYPNLQIPLEVGQLTPHFGITLWRAPGLAWENDVRGYWIHLGREFDGRQNYYSVEERLSLKWHRWTLSGMGWVGQQMFAVRNQGFALYNMAEDHRGGYGAEIRHTFGRHLEIGFRFSREHFRDLAITPNATSESYMALLAWNF